MFGVNKINSSCSLGVFGDDKPMFPFIGVDGSMLLVWKFVYCQKVKGVPGDFSVTV